MAMADQPELTHLATSDQLRAVVESSGFAVEHGNDLTDQAASTMQMFLTLPPNPLGLHAVVPDFAEKAQNLTLALTDGRLRAIYCCCGPHAAQRTIIVMPS